MKILVTGGAGFIGSHTVDLLLQRGYEVRILDALKEPVHLEGQVPGYVPLRHLEFIEADVRDKSSWETALQGVDGVFHLAAYQAYLPDFSTFFHTNTVSTALLFEVAVERKLSLRKVVIASSQAVYGEARYRCTSCNSDGEMVYPSPRLDSHLRQRQWDLLCSDCGAELEPVWTDEALVKPHNSYAVSKYTQELVAQNRPCCMDHPEGCLIWCFSTLGIT